MTMKASLENCRISNFKQGKAKEIEYFKGQGLRNPFRIKRLIERAIDFNELDLTNLVVFTETASNNYVVTSIIAAMAGAKVYAITSDSQYGKAIEVEEFTYKFAEFCGIRDRIEVIFEKKEKIINKANIITNLGFVRPIDERFIGMMNENAVIPYMCEAWEYRECDIDLDACKSKNIPVMATDEHATGLDVFDFIGPLCMKMLLELEIEIYKNKIVIVSDDEMGKTIENHLRRIGGEFYLIKNLRSKQNKSYLENCDALVIADYTSNDTFIGKDAQISAEELVELCREISVLQFAGDIDLDDLEKCNIPYFPKRRVGSYRMGMTFADIGPKPLIDLHCAGLKVGEVMAKARLSGKTVEEAKIMALRYSSAQNFDLEM